MSDSKITELSENTDPQGTDLLAMVDDPGGIPNTDKITIANLKLATADIVPAVHVYKSAGQNILNNTWTVVTFDAEHYDTDGMHDNAVNNERIICKTAGKYFVFAQAGISGSDSSDFRVLGIRDQTDTYIVQRLSQANWGGNPTLISAHFVIDMAVDDYVYMRYYQNSGSTLALRTGLYDTYLGMIRVGD